MQDNKRAADDAERGRFHEECEKVLGSGFKPDGSYNLAWHFWQARAALSGCADGGKGEAVDYRMLAHELEGVIVDVEQSGSGFDAVCLRTVKRVRDALYTAPQAECAPIAPRADADTANIYERFDTWMKGPHARVQTMLDAFAAGASNERADADTAGAKLVPVEPTEEMMRAVRHLDWTSKTDVDWDEGYRVMIAAAPVVAAGASNERADAAPLAQSAEQDRIDAFDVALNALHDYQSNWDTGLPAEHAQSERIQMECAVEAVREALNEAKGASK